MQLLLTAFHFIGWLFVCYAPFLSLGLAGFLLLQLILQWTQGKNITLSTASFLRLFYAGCHQEVVIFSSGVLPFAAHCLLTEHKC
jgi:hypothetical protein